VVGSSYTRIVDGVEQAEHAFLWENGVLTDLGVLPDDTESAAAAINSLGVIVGSSSRTNMATFQETHRAFIRENGSITAIPVPSVDAQAADINDSGVVVGTMKASGGLSSNTCDHPPTLSPHLEDSSPGRAVRGTRAGRQ
jgi:probable HAF family extracellular repeat protein